LQNLIKDDMNDFKAIYDDFKELGMPTPHNRVIIQIPDARNVLIDYFIYFLSVQNIQFIWQPEYEEVVKWLEDNQGRGLLLFGDCGRGKSILARYVIPAILLKYHRKVVSVYDVNEMNAKLDEVLKKHIISLDDIGTEEVVNNFGNKRLAFAEIMDAAEKYGKLVIISTNLKGEKLADRYKDRVLDRIIATTKKIEFKGESLRK